MYVYFNQRYFHENSASDVPIFFLDVCKQNVVDLFYLGYSSMSKPFTSAHMFSSFVSSSATSDITLFVSFTRRER